MYPQVSRLLPRAFTVQLVLDVVLTWGRGLLWVVWLSQSLAARDRWEHPCAIEPGLPQLTFRSGLNRHVQKSLFFQTI